MSILSGGTLHAILEQLVDPAEHSLVNPASIDIRLGLHAKIKHKRLFGLLPSVWKDYTTENGLLIKPGKVVILETYERLTVPNGYAMDLRLKSTSARNEWNHLLAFWFDPGWDGRGTLEIINHSEDAQYLHYMQPFAQIIYNTLDKPALKPYSGRYQNASTVELAKPEKRE